MAPCWAWQVVVGAVWIGCARRPVRCGQAKSDSGGRLSPKTLNGYLAAANVLLRWMERQGRVTVNVLRNVGPVDERGKSFERRAFTEKELERLLGVSGRRRLVYLTAVLTGLRRGELKQLRWDDLKLGCEEPYIKLRAVMTKNRRADTVPLHDELVVALRELREERGGVEPVFRGSLPRRETVTADLAAAGIPVYDGEGRKVDLHALQTTFCTMLAELGISERERQELTRHRDLRQTNQTYTDPRRLQLANAVRRLPGIGERNAHIDAHKLVAASRGVARGGTTGDGSNARKSLSRKEFRHAVASSDTTCHNGLKNGGRGNRSSHPPGYESTILTKNRGLCENKAGFE